VDEQQPLSVTKAPAASPTAQPALRASDAERDRIADVLREALVAGRLDPEEHAERIGMVYQAKTLAELEPLIRDLPAHGQGAAAPSPAPSGWKAPEKLVAIFSSAVRKGRRRVARRTNVFAVFGSVEIDLTEAVFEQREIVVQASVVFGSVEITVPENVTVRSTGTAVFGAFESEAYEATDPDAPVVSISGFAFFGAVEAKAQRGKRLKNLRA
jgi:hypothetical protein